MDQENELLEISGTVENIIYKNEENGYTVLRLKNDSGEVTGYQYQKSDADVFADTQIEYADSMPLAWQAVALRKTCCLGKCHLSSVIL